MRYGIALENEWGTNDDTADIDTIWKLLRSLPDNNIEGNVHLKEVELIRGGGGFYQWSGIIQIGKELLNHGERFEDVLRHEVGHAVHADRSKTIDSWLKTEFGWQRFGRDQQSVDAWVSLMGGWDAWGEISTKERQNISNALIQRLGGGGSWKPGPNPRFPAQHPYRRGDFGPRLAIEGSLANWYASNSLWYRANGLAFFLNFWYAELFVVKESTLDLIAKMPDRYAAMSHFEFFAELYALYYDEAHPKRSIIPGRIAKWLNTHIGKPSKPVAKVKKRKSS